MLHVGTQQLDDALIYRLEGRFTGDGAEQVRLLITRCDSKLELILDLTEVIFVDAVGEDVLLFVKKLGGEFMAETAYSQDICERLQLPLLRNHGQNSQLAGNKDGKGQIAANGSRRP
jgi:hypothetical protein